MRFYYRCHLLFFSVLFFSLFLISKPVFADLYFSILAVNGTESSKEKDVQFYLPKELKADDILDTAGLQTEYDFKTGAYSVKGKVSLGPKESRTFKVRIRDVWQITDDQVKQIQEQINESVERFKNTEYYENAQIKKEKLLGRLDYIVNQHAQFADNIEMRIDRYRTYSDDLEQIRDNAVSVKYWRDKVGAAEEEKVFNYVVELENPSGEQTKTIESKHYLPPDVKPEDIVETQGFEVRYDDSTKQSFLAKSEELKPSEKKKYTIGVKDVWFIPKDDIENLKDRTRKVFKLLENTEYANSANFLVEAIKQNLDRIEASQAIEKEIKEHISSFRDNQSYFESARKDVEKLEELLEAVRENLERSQLKNVLQRIRSLRSVADIAEAIFGTKPSVNNAWKIITSVVAFVGFFILLHYIIWGRRASIAKKKEKESQEAEKK